MTVSQMRARIIKVYPCDGWKRKVNNMPDYQVIAVYHSFLESGRFDKKIEPTPKPKTYKQIPIDI